MRRLLASALVLAASPAFAQPKHSILVLKSDGNADAKTRAKVDAAVFKLATRSDGQVTAGDISYVDATIAAGCKPEVPTCKDEVLATFATDEIVITTVTRKPGGLEISVRRATKGQPGREVTAKVAADAADVQIDGIGVLFGATAAVAPVPADPLGPAVTDPAVDPAIPPKPVATAMVTPQGDPQQLGPVDEPQSGRGLSVAGMVGGGVFMLIGVGLWGSASDVQNQIDAAPKETKSDFRNLGDLETRGDKLAGGGNLMFLAGLAIAGVSTYFFFRGGRHTAAQHAVLTPTLFDHGAGIALTFGGLP